MEHSLLREIEHLRNVQRHLRRTLYTSLDFLAQISGTRWVRKDGKYLEFIHYWYDLILECFVGNLPTPKIDFVSNENNRDVDPELAEVRKPIRRYSIEGVGIFDRVHDAYNVSFTDFRLQVLFVVRVTCKNIRRAVPEWRASKRTS
jgi:hypothetical protein